MLTNSLIQLQVDPVFHQAFVDWHENPKLDKNHSFLSKIYEEDLLPCLHFTNSEVIFNFFFLT